MRTLIDSRKLPYAYETIFIDGEIKSLSPSIYKTKIGYEIFEAIITIEGNSVFVRFDGDDPNSNEGHMAYIGSFILLESYVEIKNFKAINESSANATLKVSYFNREVLNN
jgi:hypothetical protein